MATRKKRIVINTDAPFLKTGLGKNGRWLAESLYKTGKYEIFYYACGLTWDHPDYQKFPYVIHGCMPNSPAEIQQIHSKGEQNIRDASYGNYNIDKVISEFKPDVLITSNDSWAFKSMMDKKWWSKINHIPHVTLDSLPFLPDQKEMFNKCKQVYVWADFAVKEANRLGFNNCEMLTGIINDKKLFKLPKHKKLELRKSLNIPENAFVIINVNRNQIRKEFKSVFEGYAKWKTQNNIKTPTRLLLHTNFTEPGGWNFHQFCEELNIDKSEVLTTYICKNCKKYQILPYCGNDHNCPHCKTEKSVVNIGIVDGVNEEQLNEIYNLADCSISPANAGGLEQTLPESLYCELPLATNDYSSMAMFANQPFVGYIGNTFTTQLGTQFRRAVPNINDIAKFINKIYNATEQERAKIGQEGRKWALSVFSPDVVCKQWEKIIDECPLIEYDFNLGEPIPNPSAILENKETNEDFIHQLYQKILGRDADSDGFKHWVERLLKGEDRNQVEGIFRHIATEEFNKQNNTFDKLVDNTQNKKLLVVLKESIGDLIISTSVIDSLKKLYSDCDIYIGCDPQYFDIFAGNSDVYKVLPYIPNMESEIWAIGMGEQKGLFDYYVNLGIQTQRQLNYLSRDKVVLPK